SATNFTVTSSMSAPNPTSGPVGTTGVTISGTGFVASHALTVTVTGTPATVTSRGTTAANGTATATITIPTVTAATQTLSVADRHDVGSDLYVNGQLDLSPERRQPR